MHSSQRAYFPLLSSALIPIKREVNLPLDSLSEFATTLTHWTTQTDSTETEQAASKHLLANLVNKRVEDLSDYTKYLLAEWNQRTSTDSTANTIFISIIQWIAKGLVCRNDNLGVELVTKFLDLISSNSVYADTVAGVIGGIANDNNDGVLDKKHSHAVSRILYKQRFFDVVFPDVVERYESASRSDGEFCLIHWLFNTFCRKCQWTEVFGYTSPSYSVHAQIAGFGEVASNIPNPLDSAVS